MNDHDLNRILGQPMDIAPSAGFTHDVMDAVRREAAAPPPIPFPWSRALPGLAAWAAAIVAVVIVITRTVPRASAPATGSGWLSTLAPAMDAAKIYGAG